MPEIVIPGSPAGLQALVSQLNNAAADIDSVRSRVATNGLEGAWSGQAADLFRSSLHQLPGELGQVREGLGDAASAIAAFASALAELQQQARWYDERVASAEHALQAANVGHAEAEAQLEHAHRSLSQAADPISLSSARQLVGEGESLVRQAVSDVEDLEGDLERLVVGQQTLIREYEDSVRACVGALNASRDAGGTALHGLRSWFDREVGHVEHGGAALWRRSRDDARAAERDADHLGHAALREFDEHWAGVRRVLEDTGTVLMVAGLAAAIAIVTVATAGADVPFLLAAAPLLLGAASTADAALVMGGDTTEDETGDAAEKKEYGHLIPGDIFALGVAAFGTATGASLGADAAKEAASEGIDATDEAASAAAENTARTQAVEGLGEAIEEDGLSLVGTHGINSLAGVPSSDNQYVDPALLKPLRVLLDLPPLALVA